MSVKCEHGFWGCQWATLMRGLGPVYCLCLLHDPHQGLRLVVRIAP